MFRLFERQDRGGRDFVEYLDVFGFWITVQYHLSRTRNIMLLQQELLVAERV